MTSFMSSGSIHALRFLGMCGLALPIAAAAQQIDMQSPADLPGSSVSPQIIGGATADPSRWPATLVFRNSQGAGCTATAVGVRAILTAAHCVENSSTATVSGQGLKISITCEYHPNYPADIAADFALCVAEKDIPRPTMGFETLDMVSQRPAQNEEITLLGYGCLSVGGQDRNFGALYFGSARVIQIRDKYGFVQTRGGSAVCFGDSGGAAYYALDSTGTIRHLFAINARGDISQTSWLAPTNSSIFSEWARAWVEKRNVEICGLNAAPESCRQ